MATNNSQTLQQKTRTKLSPTYFLSILALVSSTPISFNIKAKSELETPRLTNSDFNNRFALLFQFAITKNFTFAIFNNNCHICKQKSKNDILNYIISLFFKKRLHFLCLAFPDGFFDCLIRSFFHSFD